MTSTTTLFPNSAVGPVVQAFADNPNSPTLTLPDGPTITPDNPTGTYNYKGLPVSYDATFNPDGSPSSVTIHVGTEGLPEGSAETNSRIVFDPSGQVTIDTQQGNRSWSTTLDFKNGQLTGSQTTQYDPNGNVQSRQRSIIGYDDGGAIVSVEIINYDGQGNITLRESLPLNRLPSIQDDFDPVSDDFTDAQETPQRRDPLTFDLDDDGIETVGINLANPILFDHDGDSIKTATGWISPDDAFLVLDRDGNGTIDSGRELFGDSTPITDSEGNTRKAVDGFDALAAEDTNADGVVDSQDANFNNLRLWRDLNQNGISEANELFTLADAGIASITTVKTENSVLLPNGNVLADLGHYTKTDGSEGTLGDTAQLGDVDLREDTFYSQFTDSVPLTPETQACRTCTV